VTLSAWLQTAHGAGLGQAAVGDVERVLPSSATSEAVVRRDQPQRMPFVGLDRRLLAATLCCA